MTNVFLHIFTSIDSIAQEFQGNAENDLKDVDFVFASYGCDNYSGDAFVLYKKDGKLFRVDGGHCSCYGLEDQWKPEETTIEALEYLLDKGSLGCDDYSDNLFKDDLIKFLNELKNGQS